MIPPKSSLLAMGGAVVVLLVFLAVPSRPRIESTTAPGSLSSPTAGHRNLAGDPREAASWEEQLARAASLPWGRDPFRPSEVPIEVVPVVVPPAPGALPRLTGISTSNGSYLAIIDREIVREGHRLASGYSVTKITAASVTLRREDNEITLAIGDQ